MHKDSYLKELFIDGKQKRGGNNNKIDVLKIQSWLTLYDINNPGSGMTTGIDGDFGAATEQSVKRFQKAESLPIDGIVDSDVFEKLSKPLKTAFETPLIGFEIRELILNAANLHLHANPYELTIDGNSNSGPWVRSYMDGHEGEDWFWCMGFVQTIVDQAASMIAKNFESIMPLTYSCDTVAMTGIRNGNLLRFEEVQDDPTKVSPGDIFLVQKSPSDWTHTGIIISVGDETFETIEGNTNNDGSHNGNRVCKRIRNFMNSKLDVFSIEALV